MIERDNNAENCLMSSRRDARPSGRYQTLMTDEIAVQKENACVGSCRVAAEISMESL